MSVWENHSPQDDLRVPFSVTFVHNFDVVTSADSVQQYIDHTPPRSPARPPPDTLPHLHPLLHPPCTTPPPPNPPLAQRCAPRSRMHEQAVTRWNGRPGNADNGPFPMPLKLNSVVEIELPVRPSLQVAQVEGLQRQCPKGAYNLDL